METGIHWSRFLGNYFYWNYVFRVLYVLISQANSYKIIEKYNKRKKEFKWYNREYLLKIEGGCNGVKETQINKRYIKQIEKW